jgi:hypothetical protein
MRKRAKTGLIMLMAVVAMGVALGFLSVSFRGGFVKGFNASFAAYFRSRCIASATNALRQKHVDPEASGAAERIERYCSCAAEQAKAKVSPAKPTLTKPETQELSATCTQQAQWPVEGAERP